jgi:hypothetical protein
MLTGRRTVVKSRTVVQGFRMRFTGSARNLQRRKSMNKRNTFTKFIAGLALLVALAVGISTATAARTEPPAAAARPDDGAAYFIGLLRVASNRTVRIAAVNKSDHDIPVELALIDAEGKVLIQCDAIVSSGKGFADVLDTTGQQLPIDLYPRYRTDKKRDLEDLALTIQVIDNETGNTEIAFAD